MMNNNIMRYPDRGNWGNKNYRGNCSGHVIMDLIKNYYPKDKPKQFLEVFSGGGTGKDVARELNIENSIHLDLNNGWNALVDEIPTASDFTFSHPPYWDIIKYENQRNSYSKYDLSNQMSYEEFISKLDLVNEKIFSNLVNGGRSAILIGDIRRKGKYYSIMKDMTWFGDLESHIIKEQFNTTSGFKKYSNSSFIPIATENLLVFKKNDIWKINIKYTKDFYKNIKELVNVTWKDIIRACIEQLKDNATVDNMLKLLKDSKKAEDNNYLREKVRQTLNNYPMFAKRETGKWTLTI